MKVPFELFMSLLMGLFCVYTAIFGWFIWVTPGPSGLPLMGSVFAFVIWFVALAYLNFSVLSAREWWAERKEKDRSTG